MRGLSLHGESNTRLLSQDRRSFQQAVQLGSRAKSILQGELCLTQLSAALFLDVQKPRPVEKRKTRALSVTRDNVPLPPIKAAIFQWH